MPSLFKKFYLISAQFLAILAALNLFAANAQAADIYKKNIDSFLTQSQNPRLSPRDSLDDSWKLVIAPYVWALNMNGSTQIRGQRAHVDETFSDIMNQLNWSGMLFAEVKKNKLSIFVNALYASLSDGASDRYISAHVNSNFGLYSAGLSYEIYKTCFSESSCGPESKSLAVVPYIGARYTSNDISLKVNTPFGNLRRSDNKHWTDPLIGALLNFDLTKAWLFSVAGDVGGTNTVSDYSYNVTGLIGYKPQTIFTRTTWYLGYRVLDQHYVSGSSSNYFNWNMKLYGPMVGVSFTF